MAESKDQIGNLRKKIKSTEKAIATATKLKLQDEEALKEFVAELETSSNEEKSKKLTEITRRKKNIEFRDQRIKELEKQKIKQKNELQYTEAYHHFIRNKEALDTHFLKLICAGTPCVGKTTALRRLMGEIINLLVAGEADVAHPSTGAVESMGNIIVKKISSCTALVTKVNWSVVESDADEAGMLFQRLLRSVRSASITPSAATAPTQSKPSLGESNESVPISNTSITPPADSPFGDIFKKASALSNFLEDVDGAYLLRIEDTGGQPELMDMLPALTIGPGLYLLFFNLEWSLKNEFSVFYQHPSGKVTTPEKSRISLEEMLLSTLSSISCSHQRLALDENPNSSDIREILESSRSMVYLVGTHKDKVSEEKISQLDDDLQSIIRGTDFFQKRLVKFCSEGKLIVTMDNMEGGVEEVEAIKKMLDNAIEREFKKLKIPVAWLLLNICLHNKEGRITKVENVLKLSSQFNMPPEETEVALWFLHHHAGVLMHFPNVPQLNDLVILDNQVVYDSVTELILKAMTFDNVGEARAVGFRETGRFQLKDLLDATAKVSRQDFILPEKLVALLEFLHIIAPIPGIQGSQSSPEKQEIVYLMPCILRTSNKEMLDAVCNDQSRPQHIAPLMIRYECGFVPLGIFPALIASLISNKSFRLVQQGMMKNNVQFRYQPLKTLVSFLCYSRFYAIVISELSVSECDIQKECAAIRQQVVAALEQVGSNMNYGIFLDYQFAFECPMHPGKEHLCVVEEQSEVTKIMECLEYLDDRKPVKMESVHTVWWCESRPESLEPIASASSKQASTTEDAVKDLKCGNIMRLFRDNNFPCCKAKKLGTYLNLIYSKLQDLSCDNTCDVEGFMMDVINYWLETDPEKSWSKLAEAVEDCGYGVLAEKIRQKSSQ